MKNFLSYRIRLLALAAAVIFSALFPLPAYCAVTHTAVISTVSADYSGGAHSIISVDPAGGPRTVQNNLLPTATSDITVTAYENFFYRIEKFQADNITKFDIKSPDTPIWQFSTNDPDEEGSSNPYNLIFLNSKKAWLLRYGKTKAWIVNPSAAAQNEFKIGELDLSAYADSDGIPEMRDGLIADGKLFICFQRLNRGKSFLPENTAYLAVFHTAANTEINTETANKDGLSGIALPIRNPCAVQYLEENNMIYIQGAGDFGSSWSGRNPEYSGGIVSVDPVTYEVSVIIDDGDEAHHPYGNISGMTIVSPEKGYFVGYDGWGDNTLYVFNPSSGEVVGPANPELKNKNIAGMEAGTYADKNKMLWVCNASDGEVVIINTKDNSIDERISSSLNPTRVVFTIEDIPEPDDSGDISGSEPASDDNKETPESDGGGGGGCFISTGADGYDPMDFLRRLMFSIND